MRNIILISFLLVANVYAGEILYPTAENPFGEKITYTDKYSKQDFTGKTLLEADDLEGVVIYGSCFSQETPDTDVFPINIKKITFYNCNLDNVKIVKPGWIVIGGSERRFKVQNDRMDWIVDNGNIALEPIDKEEYIKLGISISPSDLPLEMMKEDIIKKTREITQ